MAAKITHTQVIEDAGLAAVFFRSLVDQGVPPNAAVSMTGSYISNIVITRSINVEPKPPWEEGGTAPRG